jgi:acyl-CoA thioesterase-1
MWLSPAFASADGHVDVGADTTIPRILVVGDSISAAYGIEIDAGWVALLQLRLEQQGYPHRVINASISGDTSVGGRSRLPALLARESIDIMILELGGNDGLRGLSLAQTQANLQAMIEMAHTAQARVLLLGMQLPPNYGSTYTAAFAAVYTTLAREQRTALVPFLLDGVATDTDLMQPDGIHPRAEAQARLMDNVWTALVPLL